jgi:hypothetical protein
LEPGGKVQKARPTEASPAAPAPKKEPVDLLADATATPLTEMPMGLPSPRAKKTGPGGKLKPIAKAVEGATQSPSDFPEESASALPPVHNQAAHVAIPAAVVEAVAENAAQSTR